MEMSKQNPGTVIPAPRVSLWVHRLSWGVMPVPGSFLHWRRRILLYELLILASKSPSSTHWASRAVSKILLWPWQHLSPSHLTPRALCVPYRVFPSQRVPHPLIPPS